MLRSAPDRIAHYLRLLGERSVQVRILIAAAAIFVMWLATGGWVPSFSYREGYIPPRDVMSRVRFTVVDERATNDARNRKAAEAILPYDHNRQLITNLQQRLMDQYRLFLGPEAEEYEKLDAQRKEVWEEFLPADKSAEEADRRQQYVDFRNAIVASKDRLEKVDEAIDVALSDAERYGVLENLGHDLYTGSQKTILVDHDAVEVANVRIEKVKSDLPEKLRKSLAQSGLNEVHVNTLAPLFANWLSGELANTLTLNNAGATEARRKKEDTVEPVYIIYGPRQDVATEVRRSLLAKAGQPLDEDSLHLLRLEYDVLLQQTSPWQMLIRTLADLGMYVAVFCLCGFYLVYHQPQAIRNFRKFVTLIGACVVTVSLAYLCALDSWRIELVPVLIFAMTIAIAYDREAALLLSMGLSLVTTLSLGQGLAEFVILGGSSAAAIQFTGRIRSRTKLIYIGVGTGFIAAATTLGVGIMNGSTIWITPESATGVGLPYLLYIRDSAAWYGACGVLAGLIMTGFLPFMEKIFDVQTDISLLELGDVAHPLLQQLIRRAPGTYNHSINVASMAEAAAEAIGGNGLLVRVGAYFHDIGKMLKPSYFIENQGEGGNKHDQLAPAMSTLVIIAHVKDGADLAHQHHLPRSIIDFIEQHHGTTLVEYFYRQAEKKAKEDNPDAELDDSAFRYPGPRPQTREAAVMMLADAVESASRTLVDPTPARIEGLVKDIAMRRLLDDQFSDCGLTLRELNIVSESLVKSLAAMYHGRVAYPPAKSA